MPPSRSESPAAAKTASPASPIPVASPQALAGMLSVTAPVALRVLKRVGWLVQPRPIHHAAAGNARARVRERSGRVPRAAHGGHQAWSHERPQARRAPGTLHINAVPWAEVWIDGEQIGETPIGNLQTRIGSREIVFRHPELGERRTTAMVTLKEPVRISMDLRKK